MPGATPGWPGKPPNPGGRPNGALAMNLVSTAHTLEQYLTSRKLTVP